MEHETEGMYVRLESAVIRLVYVRLSYTAIS